jgi:hypothetical protein
VVEKSWACRIVKQTGTLVSLQVSSTWVASSSFWITLATQFDGLLSAFTYFIFLLLQKRRLASSIILYRTHSTHIADTYVMCSPIAQ